MHQALPSTPHSENPMPEALPSYAAWILSQGDEVLSGQVIDTNGAWLSETLLESGVEILGRSVVGDHLHDLVEAFLSAARKAPMIVCTGGLGPTSDDLTAEAVARAFGVPLVFHPEAWANIQGYYSKTGRTPPESNRKQAMLPQGAHRLDNAFGTAPGFLLAHEGVRVLCLPGPPRELKGMWAQHVAPWLSGAGPSALPERPNAKAAHAFVRVTLHTATLGESWIQDRLAPCLNEAPEGCVFGTRAATGLVAVKLRFAAHTAAAEREAFVARVREALSRGVYAVDEGPTVQLGLPRLVRAVGAALTERSQKLASAESCTGGAVAAACIAQPGTSAWFVEGIVAYANASKVRRLGVDASLLEAHGAVSEPVARAMAEGARAAAQVDWAVATTGIAGPDGGTPEKPVGTIHIAISGPNGTTHRAIQLRGPRDVVQAHTVVHALHALHQRLSSEPSPLSP